MCLIIDQKMTDELLSGPEEITVYKVLEMTLMKSPYMRMIYKQGWNYPADSEPSIQKEKVSGGCLHVFLDFKGAMDEQDTYHNYEIFKMKARKEDLVAAGWFDQTGLRTAAFRRLYLESLESDDRPKGGLGFEEITPYSESSDSEEKAESAQSV